MKNIIAKFQQQEPMPKPLQLGIQKESENDVNSPSTPVFHFPPPPTYAPPEIPAEIPATTVAVTQVKARPALTLEILSSPRSVSSRSTPSSSSTTASPIAKVRRSPSNRLRAWKLRRAREEFLEKGPWSRFSHYTRSEVPPLSADNEELDSDEMEAIKLRFYDPEVAAVQLRAKQEPYDPIIRHSVGSTMSRVSEVTEAGSTAGETQVYKSLSVGSFGTSSLASATISTQSSTLSVQRLVPTQQDLPPVVRRSRSAFRLNLKNFADKIRGRSHERKRKTAVEVLCRQSLNVDIDDNVRRNHSDVNPPTSSNTPDFSMSSKSCPSSPRRAKNISLMKK